MNIIAKYATKCRVCNGPIAIADRAVWDPDQRGIAHPHCASEHTPSAPKEQIQLPIEAGPRPKGVGSALPSSWEDPWTRNEMPCSWCGRPVGPRRFSYVATGGQGPVCTCCDEDCYKRWMKRYRKEQRK